MNITKTLKYIDGPLDAEIGLPIGCLHLHHYDYDILTGKYKIAIYKIGFFEDEMCWLLYDNIESQVVL